MMGLQLQFSLDNNRNKIYQSLIIKSKDGKLTVDELSQTGYKLMRKAGLHHHFFGVIGQYSLITTALYLTFFSLQLPYEYTNKQFLNRIVNVEEAIKIINLYEKRIVGRVPVEYLSHEAFYLGYKFYVNEHVLVPRSLMNTRFVDFLQQIQWENYRVLDLCTGSGCIGISLALLNPSIMVDLADISAEALKVANINIQQYSLNDRVKCVESNLFENIHGKYDLIISNPPYVTAKEYDKSPAEFKQEPSVALLAGDEGLEVIKQILFQAKQYLNPNGLLIVETGCTAAKRLKKQFAHLPLQWLKYRRPSGTISMFAMDGVFLCEAKNLEKF